MFDQPSTHNTNNGYENKNTKKQVNVCFTSFHANALFLYPIKTELG